MIINNTGPTISCCIWLLVKNKQWKCTEFHLSAIEQETRLAELNTPLVRTSG